MSKLPCTVQGRYWLGLLARNSLVLVQFRLPGPSGQLLRSRCRDRDQPLMYQCSLLELGAQQLNVGQELEAKHTTDWEHLAI
jgi:hypothetical protein